MEQVLRRLSPTVRRDVCRARPPIDPTRAPAQGEPADRALLGAQRTPVLRAPAVRPALQVVPRPQHREPSFDASTFSKNRERLLQHEVAGLLRRWCWRRRQRQLLSSDHFTVDGTLLEAWAPLKSVPPTPRGGGKNPTVDFRHTRRSNLTHASTTDPDARLARKTDGQVTRLCYAGHAHGEPKRAHHRHPDHPSDRGRRSARRRSRW